jgi:hypothetical protein
MNYPIDGADNGGREFLFSYMVIMVELIPQVCKEAFRNPTKTKNYRRAHKYQSPLSIRSPFYTFYIEDL